jgi:hypothetical protein
MWLASKFKFFSNFFFQTLICIIAWQQIKRVVEFQDFLVFEKVVFEQSGFPFFYGRTSVLT